ncbi:MULTISPECIES: hypothetical protein [Methanobacterium]|uniref:Uncharacterized protein n=1 Tax=Methanobacterium formicicum TaxID=2162 RepID=A0A843AHP0_METFO|nr:MULTISPECIES: hypothetical protein [Methanobacterium]MBF4475102.1 hypothetical protein [Methanobacterium formicicum]MDD4810821.1 hypothetical protein [Methanobacterium formicicum]MDG3548500.1 hypothetical protein [Methanobacterium formicicum]MDH2658506.1 hypothetical protein [Methanobacterium formicicum]
MVKKRESNIKVGITCKCQDAAVARPPSLLRKVQCKKCGIFFRTNRAKDGPDLCFNCRTGR